MNSDINESNCGVPDFGRIGCHFATTTAPDFRSTDQDFDTRDTRDTWNTFSVRQKKSFRVFVAPVASYSSVNVTIARYRGSFLLSKEGM